MIEQSDKRLHAAAKAYTDKSVEQLLAAPSILDFDPDATMQRHLVSMAAALAAADAVPDRAGNDPEPGFCDDSYEQAQAAEAYARYQDDRGRDDH